MKICVLIKQVPDKNSALTITEDHRSLEKNNITWVTNESDNYALEEALRLKEQHGGEVVVCVAGPPRVTQVIREALARGADRAIHVQHEQLAFADANVVASSLATAMLPEQFDLVLTGLQSDDQGFGQTGVILAERLGLPHATIVMEVDAGGVTGIRVKRELEGGWFQWVGMPTPALLTIQSGINQLRYATLKGIMAAKRKEVRSVEPEELQPAGQHIVRLYVPEKEKATRFIEGSPEAASRVLVRLLCEEARVL